MTSEARKKRSLVAAAFMMAAVSSCSSAEDNPPSTPSPSDRGESVSQVCAGLLGETGTLSLRELLQAKQFVDNRGTLNVESAQRTAKAMSAESWNNRVNHYMCAIQRSDKAVGKSLNISARWYRLKSGDLSWKSDRDTSVYDLANRGRQTYATPYANTIDKSALLSFWCPVGIGKRHDTVVSLEASTFEKPNSATQQKQREQLTRIGHAAAVRLAKRLGCLAESELPTSLGQLRLRPGKWCTGST
jgi:hypothetical protein